LQRFQLVITSFTAIFINWHGRSSTVRLWRQSYELRG
jgi:hypothetical protein